MSSQVLAIFFLMGVLAMILLAVRGSRVIPLRAAVSIEDEAQLATLRYPASTAVPLDVDLQEGTTRSTQTHNRALWTEAEPEQSAPGSGTGS